MDSDYRNAILYAAIMLCDPIEETRKDPFPRTWEFDPNDSEYKSFLLPIVDHVIEFSDKRPDSA